MKLKKGQTIRFLKPCSNFNFGNMPNTTEGIVTYSDSVGAIVNITNNTEFEKDYKHESFWLNKKVTGYIFTRDIFDSVEIIKQKPFWRFW